VLLVSPSVAIVDDHRMRHAWFLLVIASVQLGCTTSIATSEDEQAATTAFANDQVAFDYFIMRGLTNFQAAGIVGNLDQESGVNPNSVQAGGPGRGIAQWSVGERWDSTSGGNNVLAFAAAHNQDPHALALQLDFIWHELSTEHYGLPELQATTNVTDATVVFMTKYEICGSCVQTQRVSYAKSVLAAYGAIPWAATQVSQSWPLASAPALQIKCGEHVAATVVLKNTGTQAWNNSTQLGTTMPRDRASVFAGTDWVAPNRPAVVNGAVPPGTSGTFVFAFDAPTGDACVPGIYKEYFGVVQDAATWFSDLGNGGPADDQLEALVELVPADPGGGSGSDQSGSSASGCNASNGGSGALVGLGSLLLRRKKRRS